MFHVFQRVVFKTFYNNIYEIRVFIGHNAKSYSYIRKTVLLGSTNTLLGN